jgi:hypothetical protein
MELISDEVVPKIEADSVVVTRTIIEKMDIEEYLRRLTQIEKQKEDMQKQIEGIEKMQVFYCSAQAEAQKISDEAHAAAKKEREAAMAKMAEEIKVEPATKEE